MGLEELLVALAPSQKIIKPFSLLCALAVVLRHEGPLRVAFTSRHGHVSIRVFTRARVGRALQHVLL